MVGEIFIHVHNPGFVLKREEEKKMVGRGLCELICRLVCEPRRSHNRYNVVCLRCIASSNST